MISNKEHYQSLGEQICHRIKELRKQQGLSQEQLANKADMEATFLSRIERGHTTNIQINTLEKIIAALDIDYPTFFSFNTSVQPLHQIVAKLSLIPNQEEALTLINALLDWKLNN
ncbi:TPA: helix-turn-helix transcriptional regulator [Streptococcus suis]|nr:helix-turn-helix transcriptional regulator [Streptococcus suis]HEM5151906.1 helix-turn-helix transcriptional regulator [Streptococcus suis]HEM5168964.1 helix-turn-helix transcriptional regulator [Streptococcus suis]